LLGELGARLRRRLQQPQQQSVPALLIIALVTRTHRGEHNMPLGKKPNAAFFRAIGELLMA
jgi:hypothetical protein